MNGQSHSLWAGSDQSSAPSRGQWVRPDQNPRVATSTSNPLLAVPLAALIAVAPMPEIGTEVQRPQILQMAPVSSVSNAQILEIMQHIRWVPVEAASSADVNVTPAMIDSFRKKIGLSDSSLGEIFGVSRQTVYNWRTKKTIADNPERIRTFAESLAQISPQDLPYMKRALFYPTADGRLIQDVLSDAGWANGGERAVYEVITELASKAQQLRERDQKTIARLEKSGLGDVVENA